ncbi:MAG: intradiol ring-cleavage dioxygenase [Aquabacterium sp.]
MSQPHDRSPFDTHAHAHGLAEDLRTLMAQRQRRRNLIWLAALGSSTALSLLGCGGGGDSGGASTTGSSGGTTGASGGTSSGSSTTTTTTTTASGACSVINEETAGPYPGDGSNTANGGIANALSLSGIVRSDIRTSIGGASGTADGVPLTVQLTLVNVNGSCASLEGYAIYLWHCTRDGKYSMYSSGITDQNYLRGVQPTDASGTATFQTIFPGCYSGRMPHIHFEVYRSSTTATSFSNKLKTSQLAFPVATCQAIYNSASGYSASIANLVSMSFSTDNVFQDGVTLELVSITGNVADGYVATLNVGIAV